jgi:hypothetical protein
MVQFIPESLPLAWWSLHWPETSESNSVGSEALTAVVVKFYVSWDIKPCSPLTVNRHLHITPPYWDSKSKWRKYRLCGLVVRVQAIHPEVRFDPRRYQIFWEVVGQERDSLSLMSTNEQLLGRKCSGPGLERREYGRRDPSRWPRGTLYPQKLAITWPTSGGSSVGTVRSRTQATEVVLFCLLGLARKKYDAGFQRILHRYIPEARYFQK